MKTARLWVLALVCPVLAAAEATEGSLAGRPLAQALEVLQARGVKVIFSTKLVRAEMRVGREPHATRPAELLHELLHPHGLTARAGPEDSWLVVKAPPAPAPPPAADPQPTPAPPAHFQDTIDVTSSRDEAHSLVHVPAAQVESTAGGLENVFHTLQLLPGVVAVQEFGSRLAVRGGGPDQNLIVMDGIEVQNPYRMFGVLSGVNPETVDHFELYAGAFGARYGDRLSSLLVIDTRDGSAARALQGSANVNVTDSNVMLQGRLPGLHRGTWLAAARRTYYDLVAERLTHGDIPGFTDVQLKTTWEPWPGQKLTLHAMTSHETGEFSELDEDQTRDSFETRTTTPLLAATWDGAVGPRAQLRSTLSFSELRAAFAFDAGVCSDMRRSNAPSTVTEESCDQLTTSQKLGSRDLGWREDMALQVSARHALDTGFELRRFRSRLDLVPGADLGIFFPVGFGLPAIGLPWHDHPEPFGSALEGWRSSAWVEDRIQVVPRLELAAGLRLDHMTSTGETLVSPRFGSSFALSPTTRLKLGAGIHYQSPGYEKVFLGGTAALDLTAQGSGALRSERMLQGVVGFEHDLGGGIDLRVEAYRRRFDRLIVGRLETEAERQARVARYDFPGELRGEIPSAALITRFATNSGEGRASGIEFVLTKKATSAHTRLGGWLSYSYARAVRSAYGIEYPFEFDRRHAVTLVAELRPRPWLTISTAFQAASGLPVTVPRGVRVASIVDASDFDRDGDTAEWVPSRNPAGSLVYEPDYGGREAVNRRRFPATGRLDLRVAFQPHGPAGRWSFYLDVINVTNHSNSFLSIPTLEFNPSGERPRVLANFGGGFPRVPTFGVKFKF